MIFSYRESKLEIMKKTRTHLLIFIIAVAFLSLSMSSHVLTKAKEATAMEDTVIEEPLELEEWMTKPFTAE